jgi:subtilisin family serine protease
MIPRMLPALVLTLAVCPGYAAPQEPTDRRPIERADDLPRHTYPVTTTAALMDDAAAFAALAEKLESDLRADLAAYEIRDRATLKGYYSTLAGLALRRGDDARAAAWLDSLTAVEEKPGVRLTATLLQRSLIEARRQAGTGLDERFRAALGDAVAELPYELVQAELRATKGRLEMFSRNAIHGLLENFVGPAARGGAISRELAQVVVEFRVAQDVMLPVRDVAIEVLGETIAAHAVEKPDIWAARDVALTSNEDLRPVVMAIWDTGVDTSLFDGRLWVNPDEIPDNGLDDDGNGFVDDVHGIAFDLDLMPVADMLFPPEFDAAEEPEYRAHAKGFSDLIAGVETDEGAAFRQLSASVAPDRFAALFENVMQYFNYAHGTHVAGIAARDNPAARVLVARFTSDYYRSPPRAPTEELSRGMVELYGRTIDYFGRSGVRVVNMSWGLYPGYYERLLELNQVGADAGERRALARRLFDIEAQGLRAAIASTPEILFVAAAGNEDADNRFGEFIPSSFDLPNLITAGAVDRAGDEAAFTSYGAVHLYANGYEVPSVVPGGEVVAFSGTSMAAPQVVNLAAKLLALRPELTVAELRRVIVESADDKTIGEGRTIRLMNPKAALELVQRQHESRPGGGRGREPDSGSAAAPLAQLDEEFRQLLQDRFDGTRPDWTELMERTTADTLVMVSERGVVRRLTRAEVLAALPGFIPRLPPEAQFTRKVDEVAVYLHGEVAVVQYLLESRMVFNHEPVLKRFRNTEVFRRRSGEWQTVAYHETVIPGVIVPARIDPGTYDDYVGHYRLFTGYVYTVSRDVDRLMFRSPAAGAAELMPETGSTFVLRGSLYRVLFVRDEEGAVTHLRLREFPGVEYNAIRIDPGT